MFLANAKSEKRPAFYVVFDGSPGIPYIFATSAASGSSVPLTFGSDHTFGAQPIGEPDAGTTYLFGASTIVGGVARLKTPTGFGAEVVPDQGSSSISGVSIEILDCPELRDTMANYQPIKGRDVRIFAGFTDVPASDWVCVFTGSVTNRQQFGDALGWRFEAQDRQFFEKRQVFNVLTATLSGTIASGATTVAVTEDLDAAGWPASGYARIENEIIAFGTRTTNSLATCTRGQLGTVAAAHDTGTRTTELLRLTGHPITLALQVLTSTGAGTNGAYDVLPARHGLGISVSRIDVTKFLAVRDDLSSTNVFDFYIVAPENGKEWIEREIMKPCNCYQVQTGGGLMSVVLFEPPEPDAVLAVLNDDNCLPIPSVNLNDERHYNQAVWLYDHDPISGEFRTPQTENEPTSQAKYGAVYSMVFQSKGLRTALSGQAIALSRSQRFFTRYAEPPMLVEVEGFFSTFTIEPGDLVSWSSSKPLDHRSTNRGITGALTMEVLRKEMNFERGRMKFSLLYTPFATARYAKYGQVGMPDYAAASSPQRTRFVFIGADTDADGVADLPDTADSPSNPDDPYRYQ